jgi:four helix bundle protein
MPFKFEKPEVWKLFIRYIDRIYCAAEKLPVCEGRNLKSQIIRAATSVALNIAEGSTRQTNPEQNKFLGYALRSLLETAACIHLIKRRSHLPAQMLDEVYREAEILAAKLHAMRTSLQ